MKRKVSIVKRLAVIGVLMPFVTAGCRDEEARPAPGEKVEAAVICLDCKATTNLTLAHYVGNESWPKTCPTCKKTGVFPYQNCANCGQPVPLKDPKTGRFGYPEQCPSCQRKWE
ncbi:MAG: hypothetical protein HRF43_12800 [Phycisphaerae bacterium]|jgi:DnaJ-class molecular chaperone